MARWTVPCDKCSFTAISRILEPASRIFHTLARSITSAAAPASYRHRRTLRPNFRGARRRRDGKNGEDALSTSPPLCRLKQCVYGFTFLWNRAARGAERFNFLGFVIRTSRIAAASDYLLAIWYGLGADLAGIRRDEISLRVSSMLPVFLDQPSFAFPYSLKRRFELCDLAKVGNLPPIAGFTRR
jgi:hypothetical protein